MKRYFITGTDTDCGKTFITNELGNFFPKSAAIKPIASGCHYRENQLVNSDALLHQQLSNLSLEIINPWRFKLPASPHLSAKADGASINVTKVADYCLNLQLDNIERLFIEGAGGLMVPLNEEETWLDFLKLTNIPVILVVGMKLGCLNHALLTQSTLESNKITCKGWIANCLDPNMLMLEENISTLITRLKYPLLAVTSYGGQISDICLSGL
ncbi:ATP-dependent dethiobiotin synthetase BioD [Legionella norrlandica]|uniref:ATP-dependent dethiobiotin synthetase BioD n=1 Tax=Legionella norrlandica TaxID=1498499 RepID=A0A0A2TAI9_9GAMM|nr:dethiobiotin synthase [Legionella norrlandica]KGP64398.1 ATP-dependent dethiobiotin synthetase BioD [Legionella norrlandica]